MQLTHKTDVNKEFHHRILSTTHTGPSAQRWFGTRMANEYLTLQSTLFHSRSFTTYGSYLFLPER